MVMNDAAFDRFLEDDDAEASRMPFLHQLSFNGSMLFSKNHDKYWLLELQRMLEVDYWSEAARILGAAPGDAAQRILWRASYRWWRRQLEAMPEIARICWERNQPLPESFFEHLIELERVEHYLIGLSWCETGSRPSPVNIVDVNNKLVASEATEADSK